MVKALSFKGDKKPKKRKRTTADTDTATPSSKALTLTSNPPTTDDDDGTTWVNADTPTDLTGPTVLVLPSSPPTFLATDAHGAIFASPVENIIEGARSTAEPHDVRQVWVANRIAGQELVSLRGQHGRYLSCDKYGVLSAEREAVGAEDGFVAVEVEGGMALKSGRGGYVVVEDKDGKVVVRGDGEELVPGATLMIRMQARFKPKLKANKEEKSLMKISRKELETAVGRELKDEEVKTLKKARREGNYHEALLDVKVKGKHDKFA